MHRDSDQDFDINLYTIFIIGVLAFMIFVMGCSTPNEKQDGVNLDKVSLVKDSGDYQGDMSSMGDTILFSNREEDPNMHISYIPQEASGIELREQ